MCYDLVDSTRLLGLIDIEDYEELISAFQSVAKHAIASSSGTVRVDAGDGGVAVFPADIDARDAALLAIRAGLEIVEACRRLGSQIGRDDLHVRVGIATSMTLVQRGQTITEPNSVTGPALAMATRLQALAQPDTVVVSDETRSLARRSHVFSFRGAHEVKGFAEPERVWRAVSHKREVDRFFAFGRLTSRLINRADQLVEIERCWREAIAGRGQVIVIEGDAGIGKSRILHEVRRSTRFERDKLLFFQCMPGDSRSTLHHLLQTMHGELGGNETRLTSATVAQVFADHDVHDAEVIEVFSFLLGADGARAEPKEANPEAIRERANQAARHALQAMSASGPVVIVVEDIHWIDLTSKQLLAELAAAAPHCSVLLIATTRPGAGDWLVPEHSRRIRLKPLEDGNSRLAIAAMWPPGRPAAAPELIDLAGRVSGGVPPFIEEICQWMAETAAAGTEGLQQRTAPGHSFAFENVVEARLQPLGDARDIAHAAAVAGNRFTQELLSVLLPDVDVGRIAWALDVLVEAGFVTRARHGATIVHAFRHALIQETIYKGTLRKRRQTLHRRLFKAASENSSLAGLFTTAALAEHAERAGLAEQAIETLVAAGTESSSRSAMAEARQLLEHATELCSQVSDRDRQEVLRLSAMAALGPVLTATEGPRSPRSRKNYEEGVEMANRRPLAERARWFPLYWGWWYTGASFRIQHDRALHVQEMLSGIGDPEVNLQISHCIWANDFNLGRHREALQAVEAGLALYDEERAHTSRALFGGHDAKVCALGERALSLWLTGSTAASNSALDEMTRFVDSIQHTASKAHSLDTEVVSAFYREDFDRLWEVSERTGDFAAIHGFASLAALAELFRGWVMAHRSDLRAGRALFDSGLSTLKLLGSVADLPLYLDMHATLLGLDGELAAALDIVNEAIAEAEATGHGYWLAELYRRRGVVRALAQGDRDLVAADFRSAMALATQQAAAALLQRARRSAEGLGLNLEI